VSNEQRLRHEITKLQQQWDLLNEKLSGLEQDKILETRSEERFRLEHRIKKIEAERQRIEQQLHKLETQLATGTIPVIEDESFAKDIDKGKQITKKRGEIRPVYALLLLTLPTVVVVVAVLILMNWSIPTRVQVDLTVNRAVFSVGGDESATAILNAPVRFQSITVEKFANIKLSPEKLEVADPAQYIPTADRYPQDAWKSLTVTPPVVITGEDETLQPPVTLESAEPGSTDLGILDLIRVKSGAQVILELRSDRAEDLTIQVERQESFATLSMPGSFQLISDYGRVGGITGSPYQEEDSLTYRTQLPDDRPLIEVNSQPGSLVLLLSVAPEKTENLFYKGGIPVTVLEFIRQGLTGEIETTLMKGVEGHISYPDYPDVEKVSFQSPDFLGLDKLEKFRIEEIALNQKDKGIQFRLSGVAGHIRTGSRDFPQDHRLTRFATLWQGSRLTVLSIMIVWVFCTALGGYQWVYLRSSRGEEGTKVMNFDKQKMEFIQHNFDVGAYTIAAKECVGLIEHALRDLFSRHLTRLKEEDQLRVKEVEKDLSKRGPLTMGGLLILFRKSHFLDAWARVSNKDLSGIRMINLDELRKVRNKLIHENREATRTEAEFLFNCLQVILETFELERQDSEEFLKNES